MKRTTHIEPPETNIEIAGDEESGYVLPMTALLLIPLLIFSAFAIDVGAWYLKGQQIQRASDAAALAGVTLMPNIDAAEVRAIDIAAKNGMIDQAWIDAGNPGVANADVQVTAKGDQLRVRIEAETPAFLGKIVTDDVSVGRYSVADIASDVGFGSPNSGLGTGTLPDSMLGTPPGGGSYRNGLWLSVTGYCAGYPQGDPFGVGYYTVSKSIAGCDSRSRIDNPGYRADQDLYDYVVDIPDGQTGNTLIQVFDPGACVGGNRGFTNESSRLGNPPHLRFRVYASDDTPQYDLDNLERPPVDDYYVTNPVCNSWSTLSTVGPAESGKWYVRVNSKRFGTTNNDATTTRKETGLNNFALRAVPAGGDGSLCARSSSSPTCPSIYAREWASFFRPAFGAAGEPSDFFLAQIQEEHAGKTLQIRLFDPGEGMNNLQFVNDHGESVDFSWRRSNCSEGNICDQPAAFPEEPDLQAASSCGGTSCLDVTRNRFNSQWVTVEYQLPADYACDSSCWWQVRYTPERGRQPTDRTTWSVRVIGDPAHLTE